MQCRAVTKRHWRAGTGAWAKKKKKQAKPATKSRQGEQADLQMQLQMRMQVAAVLATPPQDGQALEWAGLDCGAALALGPESLICLVSARGRASPSPCSRPEGGVPEVVLVCLAVTFLTLGKTSGIAE